MKKILLVFGICTLLFAACSEPNAPQQGEGMFNDVLTVDNLMEDTTLFLAAEFPVFFDSTRTLIHVVGFVEKALPRDKFLRKASFSKADDSYNMDMPVYKTVDTFIGSFSNLLFESMDKPGTMSRLTDKGINISKITYLRAIGKSMGQHYILYTLQDRDTNRDGKINEDDVSCLYISSLDGSGFRKLSPDNEHFYHSSLINEASLLYFKTIEDVNGDGKYNAGDVFHYFRLNMAIVPYSLSEYKPIEEIAK